ncbi:unnamed protein product [Paramecium pentaurelia]|uniref:Brix domain-containing protein n=1 Tax=Paramecium pentaurelia TaxID=43138 RepID=A0A8S1Y4B9_9CILI|nr:unnamed protein product [Paramecium pentaurelia]
MAEKQHKVFYRNHILIVPTRNLDLQHRHFMLDIMSILPHSKKTNKIKYEQLRQVIPSLCENHKCNSFIVFHTISNQLILVFGSYPSGPTVQFSVLNITTIKDLQLAGNFSKKGRVLLQFDQRFDTIVKYKLIKEIITLLFNVAQARFTDNFIDRIFTFTTEGEAQNRIWFRQYEVYQQKELREIGPRFALELISIDEGLSSGNILYQGSSINASQTQFKQKIRKSEKKFEKILNEINLKEEEIEVEEND